MYFSSLNENESRKRSWLKKVNMANGIQVYILVCPTYNYNANTMHILNSTEIKLPVCYSEHTYTHKKYKQST